MTRYVYNARGDKRLRVEDAVPVHGEDFCDSCSDCLACHGKELCLGGYSHLWIVYEEDQP